MIYIIITASINNNYCEYIKFHNLPKSCTERNNRYINSITQLLKLIDNDPNIKPIIVENGGKRETYLNNFNCDVLYTNNNGQYIHKGFNEQLDIQEVIKEYNINDDDTIIKISGRYKLLNNDFINLVKNNNKDAYVKFFCVAARQFGFNYMSSGLFAIKCKYIKNFMYTGLNNKSSDSELAEYIRSNVDKNNIMEIENLNLEYALFGGNDNLLIV
jgi:hypothetical protein